LAALTGFGFANSVELRDT
jgi:small subunit ribosomal protein S16